VAAGRGGGLGGGAAVGRGGTQVALRTRGRLLAGSTLFVLGFAVPFALLGWAAGMLNLLERSALAQAVMGGIVVVLGVLLAARTARARGPLRRARADRHARRCAAARLRVRRRLDPVPRTDRRRDPHAVRVGHRRRERARRVPRARLRARARLPFILLAVGVGRLSRTLAVLRRHGHRLQVAGGALLVVVGLAIATGLWQRWMIALRPLIQGVELPL
jgi:cytochrome c-type biogenesis protein